jgi:hypothetical protein
LTNDKDAIGRKLEYLLKILGGIRRTLLKHKEQMLIGFFIFTEIAE